MDEYKKLPPIEYGDGYLNSILFLEGVAHGGQVRMYDLAMPTGDPSSPSTSCSNRT